jgi:hypothetical protein
MVIGSSTRTDPIGEVSSPAAASSTPSDTNAHAPKSSVKRCKAGGEKVSGTIIDARKDILDR